MLFFCLRASNFNDLNSFAKYETLLTLYFFLDSRSAYHATSSIYIFWAKFRPFLWPNLPVESMLCVHRSGRPVCNINFCFPIFQPSTRTIFISGLLQFPFYMKYFFESRNNVVVNLYIQRKNCFQFKY